MHFLSSTRFILKCSFFSWNSKMALTGSLYKTVSMMFTWSSLFPAASKNNLNLLISSVSLYIYKPPLVSLFRILFFCVLPSVYFECIISSEVYLFFLPDSGKNIGSSQIHCFYSLFSNIKHSGTTKRTVDGVCARARSVVETCLTLCDPMDWSLLPPARLLRSWDFLATILEQVAISSNGPSRPRDRTCVSSTGACFTTQPPGKPLSTISATGHWVVLGLPGLLTELWRNSPWPWELSRESGGTVSSTDVSSPVIPKPFQAQSLWLIFLLLSHILVFSSLASLLFHVQQSS